MTTNDDELDQLDSKIRLLAQAYLASGRPYLLSRLGKDLGDDLKIVKLRYGRSLGEYVGERLAKEYSLVLMGQHKNIQALVAAASEAGSPSSGVDKSEAPDERPGPRFNYTLFTPGAENPWVKLYENCL